MARNYPLPAPVIRGVGNLHRRKRCNKLFSPGSFPFHLLSRSPEPPATPRRYGGDFVDMTPMSYNRHTKQSPKSQKKHVNQNYTVEEGDYIIYGWHEKKLGWTQIEREFADIFGLDPKRTTAGLQAWYYRINQKVPVWDPEGWLIFDGEEDLGPRTIAIKCRDCKNRPLGLTERYPERAIQYPWVHEELKVKARDWGE